MATDSLNPKSLAGLNGAGEQLWSAVAWVIVLVILSVLTAGLASPLLIVPVIAFWIAVLRLLIGWIR